MLDVVACSDVRLLDWKARLLDATARAARLAVMARADGLETRSQAALVRLAPRSQAARQTDGQTGERCTTMCSRSRALWAKVNQSARFGASRAAKRLHLLRLRIQRPELFTARDANKSAPQIRLSHQKKSQCQLWRADLSGSERAQVGPVRVLPERACLSRPARARPARRACPAAGRPAAFLRLD